MTESVVARFGRVIETASGDTARVMGSGAPGDCAYRCHGCARKIYGDAPLLVVRYRASELRFCSSGCALDEGFAVAVEAMYDGEVEGNAFPCIWEDHRYDD